MHDVPPGVTYLFAGLLVAMIACLAFEEKIHAKKSVIVGFFALASLFLGELFHVLPPGRASATIGEHTVALPIYIPGIDWDVIAVILGASLFVDITSRSGLFTWIAIKLTKASGGDPLKLLWCYGLMTVAFSAVLNNVTAMIIVGSLSAVSLGKLGRLDKLLGFLLIEGLLTNVGGLLTLISSVPNIIVGNLAGISFATFLIKAAPYVAVTTVATIVLGARLCGIRRLATDEERARAREQVAGFDENDGIESRGFFWFGAIMMALFLATIAAASELAVVRELGLGYVAMGYALIVLIKYKAKADQFYKAVDWDLLAFFAFLFVVIGVMEHALVLDLIGRGAQQVMTAGPWALLLTSAVASSVTDNIPLSAMLGKILAGMPGITNQSPEWWAVIFGANLGGNLTPIGSASTLVAVTIMHKHELKLSFVGFVKAAAPYALLQLALATAYVTIFLN